MADRQRFPRSRPGDVMVSANNGYGMVTLYMPREKVTQKEKALAEDTMKLITEYLRAAGGTPETPPSAHSAEEGR